MTKQIHLVFGGHEDGNREDCNVFHEIPKAFLQESNASTYEAEKLAALEADRSNAWTHRITVEIEDA